MKRRANGEGSIHQRPDGRYEASGYVLTTSGVRRRKYVYGRTRAEALAKLTKLQEQNREGIPVPDKSWRIGDYCDYWLQEVVRHNRRPNTYERSVAIVRLYIKPQLGSVYLDQLSVPMAQQFLNNLLVQGHSLSLVTSVRYKLSALLTQARREELLSRNVAQLVQLPRYQPEREVEPWTSAEAKRFLAVAKTDPLYPTFALLLLCGLRVGEVLGLRWQDVDFQFNTLRVRQQIQRYGGKLHEAPLKTRASKRDLPLQGSMRQLLLDHQAQHPQATEADLVVTTRFGTPIEHRNLARSFKRICETHGLRLIKVHDLRHTTATLMKDSGIPARDAQLILGHANISTTQQIYQHGSAATNRTAFEVLERVLWRRAGRLNCRQKLPSTQFYEANYTSIQSGADKRSRTADLRFTNPWISAIRHDFADSDISGSPLLNIANVSMAARISDIDSISDVCRRQWLVGAIAVNIAVKFGGHFPNA